LNLASVAVGISCVGPLGGKQGFFSYPSGPSQHSLSLNHPYAPHFLLYVCQMILIIHVEFRMFCIGVFLYDLSFFLSFGLSLERSRHK
jgi:hypothetical protein